MRYAFLVMAFVFSGFALSNEPSNHKAVTQKDQSAKEKQEYPKLDTSSLEKAIRESIKEASEKPDPHAAHKLQIDGELVKYTGQLSDFTMWLVIVTGFSLLSPFGSPRPTRARR